MALPPLHRKLLVLALSLWSSAFVAGQSPYLDSVRRSIKTPARDTSDVKSMVNLSMALFHESTFDSALDLAIRARKLAESLNYRKGQALALLASGYVYKLQGSYDASIRDYKEALAISETLRDELNIGKCHSFLAQVYQATGQQEVAISHLQIARKFVEKLGNQAGLSVIYLDIGQYYSTKANYDVALEYYLLSLKASTSIQAYSKMALAMNNIGVVYERLADNEKALEYYTKGLDLAVKGQVTSKQALMLLNRAGILVKLKRLDEAEAAVMQGYNIVLENGDKEYQAVALNIMANLFWKKGDPVKAKEYFTRSITTSRELNHAEVSVNALLDMAKFMLAEKQTARASDLVHEALDIAKQIDGRELVKEAYVLNARLDSARGNFKGAFAWFQKYSILDDSLEKVRSGANLAYFKEQLEIKKSEISEAHAAGQREEQMFTNKLKNWLYIGAASFNATLVLLIVVSVKLRKRNRVLEAMEMQNTIMRKTELGI